MLDKNWAWLVTELALKADNVPGGKLSDGEGKWKAKANDEGNYCIVMKKM